MSNSWCKIFTVNNQQILFWYELDIKRSQDDDIDYYIIHQIVNFNGIWCDVALKGFSEEKIQKVFDTIDQKTADDVVKQLIQLIGNPYEDKNVGLSE